MSKVRTNFVANSSSSSFIVGIAKLPNADLIHKAKKFAEDKDLQGDITIGTLSELMENDPYDIQFKDDHITISSFSDAEVSAKMDTNATYIMVRITNDEGDSAFFTEGEDIDYDIDLDFFPYKQRKLYEFIREIDDSDIIFGADRNG